ncbi:Negative cofactor 2 complex subunit beta, partial [Cucumispora dikerogammari]
PTQAVTHIKTTKKTKKLMKPKTKTQDQEIKLPYLTITRIIKQATKNNKTFNNNVKEFIMKCSIEFIHLISLEANDIILNENKKTINCDHIFKAMLYLDFKDLIKECKLFYEDTNLIKRKKVSKINKLKESGLSKTEYLNQQLELFAEARVKYQGKHTEDKHTKDMDKEGIHTGDMDNGGIHTGDKDKEGKYTGDKDEGLDKHTGDMDKEGKYTGDKDEGLDKHTGDKDEGLDKQTGDKDNESKHTKNKNEGLDKEYKNKELKKKY